MKFGRLVALFALVDFAALNAYALYASGLSGLVETFRNAGPWTWVLTADLLIALTLVSVWLVRDARQRKVSPVPYLAVTAATGSIGPLLYLVRREDAPRERAAASPGEVVLSAT